MQISEEELKRRLGTDKNLVNKLRRGNDADNRNDAGRLPDIPNAPESLRAVAGITAKLDGNATKTAEALGLTKGQVLYAVKENDPIDEKKVQEVALSRLMDSLKLLTPVSMINEKPKSLSSIAADLSRVHRNLTPIHGEAAASGVTINIYSPKRRELNDYESIEIKTGT
jgi:hypothetical protein